MAFISKQQAETYLLKLYELDYCEDYETFQEFIEGLGDTLDMVGPNTVYAYHVYINTEVE